MKEQIENKRKVNEMKKTELIPVTVKEFENMSSKRHRKTEAEKIVKAFLALNNPVVEVVDYPYKSPLSCATAIREYCRTRDIKVITAQRGNRVFLVKAEESDQA